LLVVVVVVVGLELRLDRDGGSDGWWVLVAAGVAAVFVLFVLLVNRGVVAALFDFECG
jgi:hypothetical protein